MFETITGLSQDKDVMKRQFRIGNRPIPVFILRRETLNIENGATILKSRLINNAFIIGHPVNGKIGVAYGNLLGEGNMGPWIVQRVVNPSQIHKEYFRGTHFEDTDYTTADWDTTNGQLAFTGSQVGQSLSIFYNVETTIKAKLSVTIDSGEANLTFYLTANGSDWEEVSNNVLHTFTDTGTDLRWKVTSSDDAVVTKVQIQYEIS